MYAAGGGVRGRVVELGRKFVDWRVGVECKERSYVDKELYRVV